mmetsp:Transcript_50310/g.163013  ORF Transcript_50310/g.163013 Transcript_50310/m.163013 type:complete len:212 (+) Transcript_50310:160-795(+)
MSIRCATNGYRTPRCTTVTAMRLGSYVELRHACCRLLGNDTCCRDSATLRPQRRECPGTPPQVSTKASLRLDVSERSAWWLPPAVRERLLERQRGAVTKSGELLLSCDETRSQARNLALGLERLQAAVDEAGAARAGSPPSLLARSRRTREPTAPDDTAVRRASSRGSMSTGARCRRRRGSGTSGSGRSGSTAARRRAARAGEWRSSRERE